MHVQLIIPGSGFEAGSGDAKFVSLPGYAGVSGVEEDYNEGIAKEVMDHKILDQP